jgi:hypothetical protein
MLQADQKDTKYNPLAILYFLLLIRQCRIKIFALKMCSPAGTYSRTRSLCASGTKK